MNTSDFNSISFACEKKCAGQIGRHAYVYINMKTYGIKDLYVCTYEGCQKYENLKISGRKFT